MQSKYLRLLTHRRIKMLLLFGLVFIVSVLTLSFFYRNGRLTRPRGYLVVTTPVTSDAASANTALTSTAADQKTSDDSAFNSGKKQVPAPRVVPLRFDEFDERILLSPREIVTLQIDTGGLERAPIRIDAPNGGSLNRHKGPAVLQANEAARGVQFAVGPTRGLYTLEVNRGGQTRIFEFWVDRETPVGQPGPERTFVH